VRLGGAFLVAAGPDLASPTSIWRTPLDVILPAEPSGRMADGAFRAQLTDLGKRHPVTRGLEGSDSDPPHWSRWFRLVDSRAAKGTAVMQGPDNKPLLLLSREGGGVSRSCSPTTSGYGRAATRAAARISTCCGGCRTG
jgi:hypothetical protein